MVSVSRTKQPMETKSLYAVILERDPVRAEAMRRALQTSEGNGEIELVHTLRDYRATVTVRTPDVALVGLHFPDGEAADILASRPETDPFPILITADLGDEQEAEDAMRAGAVDYVIDSGAFVNLRHAVERTLRLWKLLQACRASDAFVSRISDSISDNVFITNFAGTIMAVNEACSLALGYPGEALVGMDITSILSREDAAAVLSLKNNEGKTGFPSALRAAGGRSIPVEISMHHLTYRGERAAYCAARGVSGGVKTKEGTEQGDYKLRAVLESLEDGYWETDLTGRLTYVNNAMCRMADATRQELLSGVNLSHYAGPETREQMYRIFGEVYRTGTPSGAGDHQIARRNGGVGVFQITISLMKDDAGRPTGFRGIARDVTDRHAMEAALRESEESYRNILELSPDAIAIVRSTDARYLQVNDAFCRQTGYTAEEIIGRTSAALKLYADPTDRKRLFDILAQESRVDGIEISFRAKDGTVLDDLVSARMLRFRGEDCFLIVATPITSLKEAERALRRSEERYRSILEEMEEGYWEVDLEGRYTFFNDALGRIAKTPGERAMGRNALDFAVPQTAERARKIFREIYRTGQSTEVGEFEVVKGDGGRGIHELNVSLMRDAEGKPLGFRGVSRDVTARRQAEEEIKTHREHLALINQILRHDLTNDLLVIRNGLNLYQISRDTDLLEEAEIRAGKSMDLINKMRELESFLSVHKNLKANKIHEIVEEIAQSYPFVNMKIKGKAHVMADNALISVIDNITRNAVIHGKADTIEVTIEKQNDLCEVRIADNGTGIADDVKETIFDEGFVHGETGHTGLGLHIVKKAMEKYGGHVHVQDNQPQGTVFVLIFRSL